MKEIISRLKFEHQMWGGMLEVMEDRLSKGNDNPYLPHSYILMKQTVNDLQTAINKLSK